MGVLTREEVVLPRLQGGDSEPFRVDVPYTLVRWSEVDFRERRCTRLIVSNDGEADAFQQSSDIVPDVETDVFSPDDESHLQRSAVVHPLSIRRSSHTRDRIEGGRNVRGRLRGIIPVVLVESLHERLFATILGLLRRPWRNIRYRKPTIDFILDEVPVNEIGHRPSDRLELKRIVSRNVRPVWNRINPQVVDASWRLYRPNIRIAQRREFVRKVSQVEHVNLHFVPLRNLLERGRRIRLFKEDDLVHKAAIRSSSRGLFRINQERTAGDRKSQPHH